MSRTVRRIRVTLATLRGYGCCSHCGRGWHKAREHEIAYDSDKPGGWAAFAICETCWPTLTEDQRIDYMRAVHGQMREWPSLLDGIKADRRLARIMS